MASTSNSTNLNATGRREQTQQGNNPQGTTTTTRTKKLPAQARYWLGTIHTAHGVFVPPTELRGGSSLLVWLRGQQEIGEGGTVHWQLFAAFSKKCRLAKVISEVCNGHWEPSRSEAAEAYVWKDETAVEGTRFEIGQKTFNPANAADWTRIRDLAKGGRIDTLLEEEPEIAIKHYRVLKQIGVDHMIKPDDQDGVTGIYIYGPPGVGKSKYVRDHYGQDLYIKAQNKWWDGYQGQKFALLDDMDNKCLGHHIKIWTDRYAFTAEVKGGTMQIRPWKFIMTSNYSLEQLFEDPVLAEAIRRRCYIIYMPMRMN